MPESHNQNQYVHEKKAYYEPKRVGVITHEQITNGEMGYIILASQFETLCLETFNVRFSTQLTAMPESADILSKILKSVNISANVSYSNNSAKSVSNLVNYYKHANWAESMYHIIYMPEEDAKNISVITRNKDLLNNPKPDTQVATHNSYGQLVLYKY